MCTVCLLQPLLGLLAKTLPSASSILYSYSKRDPLSIKNALSFQNEMPLQKLLQYSVKMLTTSISRSPLTRGASDLHFGIILFLSLCLPSPMCGLRNLLWTFQKWTALLQAKIHLLKCAKCTRSYMTVQSTYINQQCFPHHFICSIKKKKLVIKACTIFTEVEKNIFLLIC